MAMGTPYTEQDRELLVDFVLEGAELKVCDSTGKAYYHIFKTPAHIAHAINVKTDGRLKPSGKIIHKYVSERAFKQGLGYKSYGSRVKWPPEEATQPVTLPPSAPSDLAVVLINVTAEHCDLIVDIVTKHKENMLNGL